jgi:nitrogen regulatory protein PII
LAFGLEFKGRIFMKLVKCIIRPNRLEEVREALSKLNVSGMTVSEVRGHGRQKGHKAIYRGREYSVTLLPKMMIEMVLPDDLVDEVLKVITETARTGEIGDGRIFVLPVEQGYNIRTGEKDIT